jgi:hypothetical protein
LLAVAEGEGAAVRLGDLAGEREADAGAGGLGREEWDEQGCGVGDAGAVVGDDDGDAAAGDGPRDAYALVGRGVDFGAGLDGVVDEVDQ